MMIQASIFTQGYKQTLDKDKHQQFRKNLKKKHFRKNPLHSLSMVDAGVA